MSERRPQWDDDVIRAVTDAIDANFGDPSYQMVWDVIAAVEDWHSKRSGCEPPCTCWADAGEQRVRAEDAESALQQVRELHHAYDAVDLLRRCGCCGYPWPCLTALAVGGDRDE